MNDRQDQDVTLLLQGLHRGEEKAKERLLELLYADLRRRAARAIQRQPGDHTLQPTELVSEAYMRLVGERDEPWANRSHFLAVASQAMRQILVDHARKRNSAKRSAGTRVPFDPLLVVYEERAYDLPSLDEALLRLAEFDPEMARAVELRFFGGLSIQETADALGTSKRTFERRWRAARVWLLAEMR